MSRGYFKIFSEGIGDLKYVFQGLSDFVLIDTILNRFLIDSWLINIGFLKNFLQGFLNK